MPDRTEKRPRARRARDSGREIALEGLGVSPGVAIGPVHLHEQGEVQVAERGLEAKELGDEIERFRAAVAKSIKQLGKLKTKGEALPGDIAEEIGFLLEAHAQMLEGSRLVRGVEARIASAKINAEAAVQAEVATIAQTFEAMEDSYLAARVADVREVGQRLVRNLTATPYRAFRDLAPGTIVIAEEITPADTALMDPDKVGGFGCALGGTEGHTAIMARALGIPAVLGVAGLIAVARAGDEAIVDGSAGRVILRPTPATREAYRAKQDAYEKAERQLGRLAKLPSVTRDGVEIALHANIELPREIEAARAAGAAGVGLLRSEFMFMNRDDMPDEEEQYAELARVVKALGGRPATIRTLDVGGEKLASALGERFVAGPNPALGLRAIRLSLKQPELLDAQLAAILRAGAHGPVRILLPMVANASEIADVRTAITRVERRLVRKGVDIADPTPPVGAMIEVPGAALAADSLAQVCDFFAIGTNDLTMYTLAIDRGDEQVAHLYNPLHPAVLRLIQFTTEAALRNRIPVSLCGEIAGDPRYTALLVGLGIRELSMAPIKLPRVKARVRMIELQSASTRAQQIMDQSDPGRIAALLDDFNSALA